MNKTFLFDLDGTLVDSVPDIAVACQTMLAKLKLPVLETSRISQFVGKGMDVLIQRCLNNSRDQLIVDPSLHAQAKQYFIEAYLIENGKRSCCYPHVIDTLTQLHHQGHTLGIVTNKPQLFTFTLLEQLSLRDFFKTIICGDTCQHKKPHPEPILYAIDQLNTLPQNCIFVGDSENDILAAKACHIPVVLMTYGYNEGKPLKTLNPDYIFDDFKNILTL